MPEKPNAKDLQMPLIFLIKLQIFKDSPTKGAFSKRDSELLPARLNINHVSCNWYS